MRRRQAGFTLIELTILASTIAILAAIAIPNLMAARLAANETATIATLRSIIAAQVQYQHSTKADTDEDGTGEFGGFLELSGQARGRGTRGKQVRPVLSGAFRLLNPNGEASRSGYLFRVFLPRRDGSGHPEPDTAYDKTMLDPNLSETVWCCYAWPVSEGLSGRRTFFINQAGEVLACQDPRYAGTGGGPPDESAFLSAGITGQVAFDLPGQDGNTWRRLP